MGKHFPKEGIRMAAMLPGRTRAAIRDRARRKGTPQELRPRSPSHRAGDTALCQEAEAVKEQNTHGDIQLGCPVCALV